MAEQPDGPPTGHFTMTSNELGRLARFESYTNLLGATIDATVTRLGAFPLFPDVAPLLAEARRLLAIAGDAHYTRFSEATESAPPTDEWSVSLSNLGLVMRAVGTVSMASQVLDEHRW